MLRNLARSALCAILVGGLLHAAQAQNDEEIYLEVAPVASASGTAVTTASPTVQSFTATIAINSAGATASLDSVGNVTFTGGVTQLNITTVWVAGTTNSARFLGFASAQSCADITATGSVDVYRVSAADEALQVDLTGGATGVASAVITSMVSLGEVQCIGIMTGGSATASQAVLAVGDVVVATPKFPDTFHSTIDVNIRNKGYSYTVTESYDFTDNVVRSDLYSIERGHYRVIQDYDDQKVIFIQPPSADFENGHCTQFPMNSSDPFIQVGEDGSHLASTQGFLGFANADTTPTYIPYSSLLLTAEERNVRGVPVDIWQYTNAGYVVDFSFAVPQWRNERNWTENRPLRRIRLQGAIAVDGGGTRNIDHVYDYIGFQPGLPDWVTFNPCKILPKGKDCPCIDFLHTGTLDNIGTCSNESKAGLLIGGIVAGAVAFSLLWLLLFWLCAGVSLCNLRKGGAGGAATGKNLEMSPVDANAASPYGGAPVHLQDVKFEREIEEQ